jgi:hypothetical protein
MTVKKSAKAESTETDQEGNQSDQASQVVYEEEPVVVTGGKKSKKRRRYSSRLGEIQRLERGSSKAARRLVNAVDRGLGVWAKNRNKSALKKRDGAVRDSLRNCSKAIRRTMIVASEAPADVVDAVANLKTSKRLFR